MRIYGLELVNTWTLWNMATEYFLIVNREADERYEKQYDRYLSLIGRVEDPEPPEEPPKWLVRYDKYAEFVEIAGYELI